MCCLYNYNEVNLYFSVECITLAKIKMNSKLEQVEYCLLWKLKYLKHYGMMMRQGEVKGDNFINTTGRNWESSSFL